MRLTTTQRGYGHHWQKLQRFILQRDRYVCHWHYPDVCWGRANTADHVIPKIEGGTDHPANLVAACTGCNSRRSLDWVVAHRGRRPKGAKGGGLPRGERAATGVLAEGRRFS